VHQAQHNQPVKRGDHPAAVSAGVASPGVLCAVLDPTISDECEGPWMHPEGSNKAGERAGRNVLGGAAKDFGLV